MLFARVPQGVLIKAGLGFHSVPFFFIPKDSVYENQHQGR